MGMGYTDHVGIGFTRSCEHGGGCIECMVSRESQVYSTTRLRADKTEWKETPPTHIVHNQHTLFTYKTDNTCAALPYFLLFIISTLADMTRKVATFSGALPCDTSVSDTHVTQV